MKELSSYMRLAIILSLLLCACAANAPKYTGQEQGNLVVYRPLRDVKATHLIIVEVDNRACSLAPGDFFEINIAPAAPLTISEWGKEGKEQTIAKPGDYVKAEFLNDTGWIYGAFVSHFILSKVPPADAKKELQGFKRYCE